MVRSALSQAAYETAANGKQLNAPAIHPWPAPAKAMKPNNSNALNSEAMTYFMRVYVPGQVRAASVRRRLVIAWDTPSRAL